MKLTPCVLKAVKAIQEILNQSDQFYTFQVSQECKLNGSTVEKILKRMEVNGLLMSTKETPAAMHVRCGTQRRIYYRFTVKGENFLKSIQSQLKELDRN